MAAELSIIIPTLNAADGIGPVLAALATGLGEGLIRELIIADGGSEDQIAAIADHAGSRFLTTAPGRGTQLAAGAYAARGNWLLFLHADTVLAPDWPDAVRRHMAAHPTKAGYFRLQFDTAGFTPKMTAAWANLRARLFGLPFGDQGLLIPRRLYDSIGGFPAIPLLEDVAIARKLRRRLRPLAATATTSARRYAQQGWLRRGWGNQLLLLQYFLGANPHDLAGRYD